MSNQTQSVSLNTAVPGPMSAELQALRHQYVPRGVGNVTPIFAARTQGAVITDVDGNRYIDFAGGIGVLNLGANHPEVVAAVKETADAYLHTCFHVTMNEPYVRLAEAVENAIKIARLATGRGDHRHGERLSRPHLDGDVPDRQGGAL